MLYICKSSGQNVMDHIISIKKVSQELWWMKTITEEMSNYSSWLGDFSWSEIGDVSNQKYVHLSFQFINYWMSSILQFMVWFSDKLKNIYSHTKNNWFQFSCHGFSSIPSKQTASMYKSKNSTTNNRVY